MGDTYVISGLTTKRAEASGIIADLEKRIAQHRAELMHIDAVLHVVRVLWWNGERWGASGPFGVATMPLDQALDYVANDPVFWIHA